MFPPATVFLTIFVSKLVTSAAGYGINEGCQTFEHALFTLYKQGKITAEQALANSDNPNNLRLKIKLDSSKGDDELENLIGGKELREKALRIKGINGSIATSFRKL